MALSSGLFRIALTTHDFNWVWTVSRAGHLAAHPPHRGDQLGDRVLGGGTVDLTVFLA